MTRRLAFLIGVPVVVIAGVFGGYRVANAGGVASAQNTVHQATAIPAITAACSGTHIWAVVNANGTLARHGSGCGVTASGSGGAYDVVFPKNIASCAYVATLGSSGREGEVAPGYATVVGDVSTDDGVFVETWNSSGVETAEGFHLVVDC